MLVAALKRRVVALVVGATDVRTLLRHAASWEVVLLASALFPELSLTEQAATASLKLGSREPARESSVITTARPQASNDHDVGNA